MSDQKARLRKGQIATVAIAVLTLVAATACSSSKSSGGSSSGSSGGASSSSSTGAKTTLPATVNIALAADLTGTLSFYGTQLQAGVKAGIDAVNSNNMLHGAKLVLSTTKDTTFTSAGASTAVASLVQSDPVAILGPSISSEALASAPLAQAASIPFFAQTSPPGILDAGAYVYSTATPQVTQIAAFVPTLGKQVKTVGLVYASDNPTNAGMSKTVPDQLTPLGIKVTNNIGVPLATTDFGATVTKVISDNPDSIGILAGGTFVPSIVKALRTAGYKGLLWGTGGADGTVQSAGSAAEGFEYQTGWAANLTNAASKQFQASLAKVAPDITPYYPAVDGFTEVMFLADALNSAGAIDHASVLKGLQTVSAAGFDGPGGKVTFTGTGNRQLISPTIFVQIKDGKTVALPSTSPSASPSSS